MRTDAMPHAQARFFMEPQKRPALCESRAGSDDQENDGKKPRTARKGKKPTQR